jgi:hypothetical protein
MLYDVSVSGGIEMARRLTTESIYSLDRRFVGRRGFFPRFERTYSMTVVAAESENLTWASANRTSPWKG